MKKGMKQSTLMNILNVCSIVLLLGVAVFFVLTNLVNSETQAAYASRYDLTQNANRFMNGSASLTDEVRAYAATSKQVHYDNYWNEINTLKNRDIGLANMQAIGITAQEQGLLDEMSGLSNKLVPLEEESMAAAKEGRNDAALEYVYGNAYEQEIGKINALKESFLTVIQERTQGEIDMLKGYSLLFEIISFCFVAAIIVLQLLTIFVVRRRIIKPIVAVQAQMQEIAIGNLHASFALEPDSSEIGMLIGAMLATKAKLKEYIDDIASCLGHMAEGRMDRAITIDYIGDFRPIKDALTTILNSLNMTLSQISIAADQVSMGADQVSGGAQALSQGATQQASSIQELSATITEISQQVKQNAQNAQNARTDTDTAGAYVVDSNQQMQQMIQAMNEIGEKSSEVGKIIKTIDNIAFQTNILALNAAVEAARAGVAGKGFAVVADEVRNLAGKSAEAAKITAALINEAITAISNGTHMADDTAKALGQVVAAAQNVTRRVEEIATATDEQANFISQVTLGVDQISSVVQTNSATAEQSAAASQELSGQANMLKALVGKFTLRRDHNTTSFPY